MAGSGIVDTALPADATIATIAGKGAPVRALAPIAWPASGRATRRGFDADTSFPSGGFAPAGRGQSSLAFSYREMVLLIQSVKLVALPNAPAYQEKVYRAILATGDSVDLFQAHWDVPLPPESLIGLTVQAARQFRNERMLAVAQGQH